MKRKLVKKLKKKKRKEAEKIEKGSINILKTVTS